MKGMGVTILLAFLIIISTGIFLSRMIASFQEPKSGQRELAIKEDVYLFRDSLKLAKVHLDKAAGLSLIQGMYDNGRRGGLSEKESIWTMIYEGTNYTLLYNNSDIFPSEEEYSESLGYTTRRNFRKYTKSILSFFIVELPEYNEMEITKTDDYNIRLRGAAVDLSITSTTDNKDEITVENPSSIDLHMYTPYYQLHKAALGVHEDLKTKLHACDKDAIERKEDEFLYKLEVDLLETNDGSCLVKVNVTSRNRFLVWNGTNTTLRRISLVFLERLGTALERCGDCLGSLGSWCVQSELCSTNDVSIDCPFNSSITPASSCQALEQVSCEECLGNSASLEQFWAWCPDSTEDACAEKCAGRTIYNKDEC